MLATQNPIELEGTYPLPEAQLDRFMFNVVITYLSEDDEVTVVTQTTGAERPAPARVLTGPDILQFQELARQVVIAEEIARYTVRLVDASRPGRPGAPDFIEKWVKWGAGLRASQALVRGAKARALMHGRYHVVDQGHPGAGQADPAPPHHDQLLRRVGAHQLRRDHRAADRGRAGAQERDVGDGPGPRTSGRSSIPRSWRASARSS